MGLYLVCALFRRGSLCPVSAHETAADAIDAAEQLDVFPKALADLFYTLNDKHYVRPLIVRFKGGRPVEVVPVER